MTEETKPSVGKLIKEIRESMRISLNELARRTSVSSSYLSRIEGGESDNVSNEIAVKLAKELSKSDALRARKIELAPYSGIPLVGFIIDELKPQQEPVLFSTDIEAVKELAALAPYASDEIKAAIEHAKRNKVIMDIRDTLRFHHQDGVDFDYAASIMSALQIEDLKNQFNLIMNEARRELDEKKVVTAFIRVLCQGEGIK